MKTLLLLRHAKSSWDDPSLDDFDRPLNSRGLRAAPAMGAWIRKQGLVPDRVLCSAACRARETWEGVSGVLGETPEVTVLRSLYLAEPDGILDLVRRVEAGYETLLVVGHNPGFEDLARALAQGGKPRGPGAVPDRMPTGALAVFRFDVDDWREVGSGAGVLEYFVRPRELPGGE